MNPSVSVIVPVYNVASFLPTCLATLVEQTLSSIEIIVVNDGSVDDSQSVIDGFVERFPDRVRCFQTKNAGPATARNVGLAAARGEYVGFADGDDSVEPEMFEELMRRAKETDADIVVCGYRKVDLVTGARSYHRQGRANIYGRSLEEYPEYLAVIAPYVWNKIFRRSLIESSGVRFPDGRLFEDIPFTYSLLCRANRIEKVQRALYRYSRSRADSITHSYSPRNMEIVETLSALNEFYRSHDLFTRFENELRRVNLRFIYNRFAELPNYDGVGVKQEFVRLSRAHLDRWFPGWGGHLGVFRAQGENWRLPFFRFRPFMYAYALLPRVLHEALDWMAARRADAAEMVKRFSVDRRVRLRYARLLKSTRVDPSMVLFEGPAGEIVEGSPLWMMRDLARRGTHRIAVSAASPSVVRALLKARGVDASVVRVDSAAHSRLLASAGRIISSAPLPPYFVKRSGQIYLNTGLGLPARKAGRSDRRGFRALTTVQGDMVKCDYLLFPSQLAYERTADDYMLEAQYGGIALVMEQPKCDAFTDEQAVHELLGELGLIGKRVCLWAPSAESRHLIADVESYASQIEDILIELDLTLTQGTIVLVRAIIPLAGHVEFARFQHIKPAPEDRDLYELLAIADCLITDYSATLFDFASTGRQIVVFSSGSDSVAGTEPYIGVEELPFPHLRSARALGEHLGGTADFLAGSEYRQFASRFSGSSEGGAASALNDVLLGLSEPITAQRLARAVDIVFIAYLTKAGRIEFERLLATGFNRDDVVFVMSGSRYRARAAAYLYKLSADRGMDVAYRVTSDRMLLSILTAIMSWASRRFGLRFKTLDRTYLQEARRLFGTTRIRSAQDFSGYKKFSAMARVIDEHANSKAL